MTFSGSLRYFADNLVPDQNEISRAKRAIHEISQAINKHYKGPGTVDRITPFGSLPKKTSLEGSMDVDMIVYINDRHPPFIDVVATLVWIVRTKLSNSQIDRVDQFGVYFMYENVKVDLLSAENFLPPNGERSEKVQHTNALKHVKSLHSSQRETHKMSLAGASVLFEKSKDAFSHSLSRLAKYWSRGTPAVSNVQSLSSVMEYLGAWSAKEESRHQDLVRGFRHLLQMIISLDSMNVYWTELYAKSDIPQNIVLQRPLLLDPCNPYNNFMKLRSNEQHFRQMSKNARATLNRIDVEERRYRKGSHVDWEDILSS